MPWSRLADSTAYATNWWVVLAIDGAVGAAVVMAGVVLLAIGHPLAVVLVLIGIAYLVLVGRRYLRWRRLRSSAGL